MVLKWVSVCVCVRGKSSVMVHSPLVMVNRNLVSIVHVFTGLGGHHQEAEELYWTWTDQHGAHLVTINISWCLYATVHRIVNQSQSYRPTQCSRIAYYIKDKWYSSVLLTDWLTDWLLVLSCTINPESQFQPAIRIWSRFFFCSSFDFSFCIVPSQPISIDWQTTGPCPCLGFAMLIHVAAKQLNSGTWLSWVLPMMCSW